MRFRGAAAIFATAMAVAACGNFPRPFAPDGKTLSLSASLLPAGGVGVVIDGAGCPIFAEAVVAALRRRDIAATMGPGNLGSLKLVCASGAAGKTWLLTSAGNRWIGEIPHDSPDGVARGLLTWIGRDALASSVIRRPALVIAPIIGAPDYGATALARAIALALKGRGLGRSETTLLVKGSVVVTESDPVSQHVAIGWALLAPDGNSLGIIHQENIIDAGAVDGVIALIDRGVSASPAQ